MHPTKALDILKKAGYVETTIDTSSSGRLAHVIYLIADGNDGDINIYQQSTRAVRSNFDKFKKWLVTGEVKHLPIPIQRKLEFTNTGAPLCYVRAFHRKEVFLNNDINNKLRRAKYVELGAKERTAGPYVSVYKVGITGDDRYKIIVSKYPQSKVVSQFITKSKEQVYATYDTKAEWYRNWCTSNARRLDTSNATVEVLATDLLPGAGKLYAELYLTKANKALVLNSRW